MIAPPPAALLDVTRLCGRRASGAPTGIDRVELAYAEWLLGAPDAAFVRTTRRFGPQAVPRERVARMVAAFRSGWDGGDDPERELQAIERRVADAFGVPGATAHAHVLDAAAPATEGRMRAARTAIARLRSLAGLRRSTIARADQTYFHVSHQSTDEPHRFRWLAQSGARTVFACHDLIPIRYPEYVQPGARAKHLRRIETVTRLADLVFVISHATRNELIQHIETHDLRRPEIVVAPLGLEPIWSRTAGAARPVQTPVPYFLCVGTIEARKNHAFLLTVWRQLVECHGDAAPILLLAGKRGWELQSARALLERCRGFDGHVHELGAVSDAALDVLMRNAAGVLTPSFAEGMSYPPIEAAVMGTPVVASDIPAHREYLDQRALLDPCDGEAWKREIMALAEARGRRGPDAARVAGRTGTGATWADHFTHVLGGLDAVPSVS